MTATPVELAMIVVRVQGLEDVQAQTLHTTYADTAFLPRHRMAEGNQGALTRMAVDALRDKQIDLNGKNEPLKDMQLNQALTEAIRRDKEELHAGVLERVCGTIRELMPDHTDDPVGFAEHLLRVIDAMPNPYKKELQP